MPSRVQYLCDPCFAGDEHADGEPRTLTIDGRERTIILCARHDDQLLKPVLAMLDEFGVKPAIGLSAVRPRAVGHRGGRIGLDRAGTVPLPAGITTEQAKEMLAKNECFYPDCGHKVKASSRDPRTAMGQHLKARHSVTITELGLNESKEEAAARMRAAKAAKKG